MDLVSVKAFINSDFWLSLLKEKTAAPALSKARFGEAKDSTVVVTAVDGGKFKVGDKIGSINGKEVKNLAQLEEAFSKPKHLQRL